MTDQKPYHQMNRKEAEDAVKQAEAVLRAEYWAEVRSTVDEIKGELRDRIKDGEAGEPLREWLIEHVDQYIDGHEYVIYTWHAQKVLLFSENSGAYVDEFGDEGLADEGGINWSRLAYAAFRADVIETLTDTGVDYNDPDSDESKEALGIEPADEDDQADAE